MPFPAPNWSYRVGRNQRAVTRALLAYGEELALDLIHHHRRRLGLAKGGGQPEESNMRSDTLENILKDSGPVSVCKAIVDRGRSPCDEHELVAVLSKHAAEQFNMPGDRAFARLFEAEESVRRACNIAKVAEFSVFDIAKSDPAPNADSAYAALMVKAEAYRSAHPDLSIAQCFAEIYTDRANIELAKRSASRVGRGDERELRGRYLSLWGSGRGNAGSFQFFPAGKAC
jgi:hypothetical protein